MGLIESQAIVGSKFSTLIHIVSESFVLSLRLVTSNLIEVHQSSSNFCVKFELSKNLFLPIFQLYFRPLVCPFVSILSDELKLILSVLLTTYAVFPLHAHGFLINPKPWLLFTV
jgi:hypothetical protein